MKNSNPELSPPSHQARFNWFKVISLSLILALVLSFGFMLLTLGILGTVVWQRLSPELVKRDLSVDQLITEVKTGWNQDAVLEQGQQNWLILGIDSLETRGDVPPLTDTIMLAGIQPKTAQVNLVSLPRDLWFDDVKTKINALYAYGLSQNPAHPEKLVSETLTANLKIPVHKTIIISMAQLESLIDILGGIQIDVPVGFTDPAFPRTDVDIAKVRDPKLLYESVTFAAGPQKMSGAMALKYIRSRHSGDDEGTDIARGQRQQLVIMTLVNQLADVSAYKQDPTQILDLWQWYDKNFANQVSVTELVSLFKPMLVGKQFKPTLQTHQLSVATVDKFTDKVLDPGAIYNPVVKPNKYLGQWVYVSTTPDSLSTEVAQKLYQK